MRFIVELVCCLACLAFGWYAHIWCVEHPGNLPSVTVTVAPPAASFHVTRPRASVAAKPRKEATAREDACPYGGPLDACKGDGYVTPGIVYYPPP